MTQKWPLYSVALLVVALILYPITGCRNFDTDGVNDMAKKDTASSLGKKAGMGLRNRMAQIDAAIDGDSSRYSKRKPVVPKQPRSN
jgi:hypothetical protein